MVVLSDIHANFKAGMRLSVHSLLVLQLMAFLIPLGYITMQFRFAYCLSQKTAFRHATYPHFNPNAIDDQV